MKKRTIIVLIVVLLLITSIYSYGEENSKIGIFPEQTIIIGTHAIHFSALNDEIIDIAEKSKDESGQNRVYYKSELADGQWFDITDSQGLNSIINDTESIVPTSVIRDLALTHWTNKDGVTIELSTGNNVSVHMIDSYKNPNNIMPELKALKTELDINKSKYEEMEDKETGAIYKSLNRLFEINEDKTIGKYESLLVNFDEFIKFLKEKKHANENMIDIAYKNKENIKAQYDILCLQIEKNKILKQAQKYSKDNGTLAEKLYTAINNIENKIASIQLETYDESTSLGTLEAHYSTELNALVQTKAFEKAYESLRSLCYINNILDGLVVDKIGELSILSMAKDDNNKNIQMLVAKGDPEIYIKSKTDKESTLVLNSIIEKNETKLTELLQEKINMKDYTLIRLESDEEKIGIIASMRDKLIYFKGIVPISSDIHDTYIEILDKFISELGKELAKLRLNTNEEYLGKKAELDSMNDDADYLNEAYLDAIEKGDLALAESIEGQLEQLSNKRQELQNDALGNYLNIKKQLDDAVASGNAGLVDKLNEKLLENQMILNSKDETIIGLIDESKNNVIDAIKTGDLKGLEEKVNNLKDLLDEVGKEVLDSKNINNILEEMNGAYEKEYAKVIDSGNIALSKEYANVKHLFYGASDDVSMQLYAFLDKIIGSDKYKKLLNDIVKLEENLSKLESEINTSLRQKSTKELEEKLDIYIDVLNNYDIKQKQKIMVNILLVDLFKKQKQTEKENGNLDDEMYTIHLKTAETTKSNFILDLLDIENNKYADDYLDKIHKTSINSEKLKGYKIISVDRFVMTDFNVPFVYPVLVKNNGTYFIPLRTLYETFGGKVSWSDGEKKAVVAKDDKTYTFKVGKKVVITDTGNITLPTATQLIQGKTYIPVEFIRDTYNSYTYSYFNDNTFIIYGEIVKEIIDEAKVKIYKLSN